MTNETVEAQRRVEQTRADARLRKLLEAAERFAHERGCLWIRVGNKHGASFRVKAPGLHLNVFARERGKVRAVEGCANESRLCVECPQAREAIDVEKLGIC